MAAGRGYGGRYPHQAASAATRQQLTLAAQALRQRQTSSEQLLWEALRARRHGGRKFRRQARVGHYIVDFYCPGERLVIEIDGGIHDQQAATDRDRQAALEELGLRVLRVTAQACEQSLDVVLRQITNAFLQ